MELKPCPFCGGEAKIFVKGHIARGTILGWEFGVHCTKCGIALTKASYRVELYLDDDGNLAYTEDDRQQASEAWNRRT